MLTMANLRPLFDSRCKPNTHAQATAFKPFQIIANLTIRRSRKNESKAYRVKIIWQWCNHQPSNDQPPHSNHPSLYQAPSSPGSAKQLEAKKVIFSLLLLHPPLVLVLPCRRNYVACVPLLKIRMCSSSYTCPTTFLCCFLHVFRKKDQWTDGGALLCAARLVVKVPPMIYCWCWV